MYYPKIQSLYKRDGVIMGPDGNMIFDKRKTHTLRIGDYSHDEFSLIKHWQAFEKIDGTNIRITFTQDVIHTLLESPTPPKPRYENRNIRFDGRTSDSDIPKHLKYYLEKTFTAEKLQAAFPEASKVILFGEGYGPKIQTGGRYRDHVSFILFDINCEGWWLKYEDRLEVCQKLGIDHVPLLLEKATEEQLLQFVKENPISRIAKDQYYRMEGIVCCTDPLLKDRKGDIVKFKLRCEDFDEPMPEVPEKRSAHIENTRDEFVSEMP